MYEYIYIYIHMYIETCQGRMVCKAGVVADLKIGVWRENEP